MKPMKNLLTAALVCTLSAFATGAAFADQMLTIKVPVKMTKIDKRITAVHVDCELTNGKPGEVKSKGQSATTFMNPDGTFDHTLVVQINVSSADVAKATGYSCQLFQVHAGGPDFGVNAPGISGDYAATPNSVGWVSGSL